MTKIWEVDWTKYDPVSSVQAVDNIVGEVLPSPVGTPVKINPLPGGFSFRQGILLSNDGTISRYSLDPNVYSKQYFSKSYTERSFVMWYYTYGTGWDQRSHLWGEHSSNGTGANHGWRSSNNGTNLLEYWVNGSDRVFYPTSFLGTTGWKLIVATCDRPGDEVKVYGRSAAGNYNGTISTAHNTTTSYWCRWGDNSYDGGQETNMAIGYQATHDNILTETEIDAIYSAFLVDSIDGSTSFATLTGIVVDETFNTVEGAEVFIYSNDLNRLTASTVSASGGVYSADVPYPGNYTVSASRPPLDGSVSEPFIVSSGGIITFVHD